MTTTQTIIDANHSLITYDLYGLTPSFCTCSVNSRTTCANLGPSAAETHSRRKRSSSIPKSASISLMASARFSAFNCPPDSGNLQDDSHR